MPAYENRLLSRNVNLPSCSAHPSGKLIGAGYLLWLGIKILRSRSLFSFQPASWQSLPSIFLTGLLSAALNPKPGIFVLAFIPQFVDPARGSVTVQMVVYGVWFEVLTALRFALMGVLATESPLIK